MAVNHVCGMLGIFFTEEKEVTNFAQAASCNQQQFTAFFHAMLDQGVYLAPSPYEAGFVSSAHSKEDIETSLDLIGSAFQKI